MGKWQREKGVALFQKKEVKGLRASLERGPFQVTRRNQNLQKEMWRGNENTEKSRKGEGWYSVSLTFNDTIWWCLHYSRIIRRWLSLSLYAADGIKALDMAASHLAPSVFHSAFLKEQ